MDEELMRMDEELATAFEPVARDLRAAGFEFRARQESGWGGPDPLLELFVGGERIGGSYLPYRTSEAERVVRLASDVQDMIVEFVMPAGKAVAWPACKAGHPHPMSESYGEEGEPVWVCHVDRGYRFPIGSWQPPADRT